LSPDLRLPFLSRGREKEKERKESKQEGRKEGGREGGREGRKEGRKKSINEGVKIIKPGRKHMVLNLRCMLFLISGSSRQEWAISFQQ
jgi:hypothetical protein